MRKIEAGRLGGRRLAPLPRNVEVRPTAAKVRAAVFDRLQDHVVGSRVLDLFAGSGALSIEALSRGAVHATLVDHSRAVTRFLQRQLEGLGLRTEAQVHCHDALAFVRNRSNRGVGREKHGKTDEANMGFDLVVVDPPYDCREITGEVLAALIAGQWLCPSAVVVCERARLGPAPQTVSVPPGLELVATRTYGQTAIDFLAVSLSSPIGQDTDA